LPKSCRDSRKKHTVWCRNRNSVFDRDRDRQLNASPLKSFAAVTTDSVIQASCHFALLDPESFSVIRWQLLHATLDFMCRVQALRYNVRLPTQSRPTVSVVQLQSHHASLFVPPADDSSTYRVRSRSNSFVGGGFFCGWSVGVQLAARGHEQRVCRGKYTLRQHPKTFCLRSTDAYRELEFI